MSRRSPGTPLIFLYHSITPYDEDPFQVTIHPRRLREQLGWLRRRRLRGTSVGHVLAARAEGNSRGLVALTFDDGYADFVEYALPILAEYGFSATLFALSGRLGGWNAWDAGGPRKALMTAAQLREVAQAGIEIGSHGHGHIRLASAPREALQEEVFGSRDTLRALTGQPVDGFCYPWGDVSAEVVEQVRAAGYGYACGVWHSTLPRPFALHRTYLHDGDHSWRLDAKRMRHLATSTGRLRLLQPRPPAPSTPPDVGTPAGRPR